MGEDNHSRKNESNSWFRALFDAQPDCIFQMDERGVILDVNSSACQLLEYSHRELVGANLALIVPRENLADSYEKIALLRQGGQIEPYRKSLRTRDGRLIPFEIRLTTTTDESGRLIIQSTARDLREQMETQRRLETNEQFVQTLMQSTLDIILVKDADGRLIMVNQAFLDLTERQLEELLGNTELDLFNNDQSQWIMEEDREVLLHGKTMRAENQFTLHNGKTLIIDYTKAPIRDKQGHIIGLLAVGRDITAERSIAQQLIQAQKMEAVGTMAGEIANDFNKFLTSIQDNLTLAEKNAQQGESALPQIETALDAVRTTVELTNRLLNLSRAQPSDFTRVNLAEVVNEIVGLLRSTLDRKVRISATLDPNLWPVHADRSQIYQTLMNLCLNARDALEERSALAERASYSPWIEIAVENVSIRQGWANESPRGKPGDYVRITVSDNGIGIDPAITERVFEPFFSTKTRENSSGLGLSMVYAIVTNHHGWVTVESEPGMGSDFIVYFPRDESVIAKADPAFTNRPTTRRFQKVLVIDDEIMVRGVIKSVLLENGFQVFTAENGAKGWETLQRYKDELNLIILDLIMPEMSGKHFVEMMQKAGHRIPVLVCTGYPGDMVIDDLRSLGVTEYLGKPFAPVQLLDKVRQILKLNPPPATVDFSSAAEGGAAI
ncbi:MAG: PAS domain S-box protein [Myxococcales bacterium]|nr:PAS domain S-box protein [Myxococcales bacterium]